MIEINIHINEGNYLWDSWNQRLIKYDNNNSIVLGNISNSQNCNVAFPIPLNEDVLEALDFVSNNNAGYSNGSIVIKIDGTNLNSILVLNGIPVLYVSDIQNYCMNNKLKLKITESKLETACKAFLPSIRRK